jgi:molybdate transport system substrate-binding protein
MANAQSPLAPSSGEPLRVYAAGSLREALTEAARAYEARTGVKTQLTFGASGLLRERIEKGEPAQVFASADTQHPQRLFAAAGSAWAQPTLFVRNQLCALAVPQLNAEPGKLLDLMLDPAVKLGTSTPKADPSGDYAWEVFRKAEALKPGAYAALDARALKLTGSPEAPQPPAGRGVYEWLDLGRACRPVPDLLHQCGGGSQRCAAHERGADAAGLAGECCLWSDCAQRRCCGGAVCGLSADG